MKAPNTQSSPFLISVQGATLCVLSLLLLFGWLGTGSIQNSDDAVYAWAARAMVEEGAWFSYRWHGAELHTYYPPLYFVLLKLSVLSLGVTELALRLPAAISALACVLLTAHIAHRISGSRNAGLFAGLSLLVSASVYLASRSVRLDMTFLAFALTAYWAYLRAAESPRSLWLVGLSGGLAYLTKSVLVAFIALPIALDLLMTRRAWLRSKHLYGAAALAVVLASVWHIALLKQGAPMFPAYGERVLQGIAGDYTFAAMVNLLAESEGYATLLYAAGFAFLVFSARNLPSARFFAIAVCIGLAILMITRTAMPHYALPLFPPLAIGFGLMFANLLERRAFLIPLGACGLLALFVRNNLGMLVNPDFSPGVREVAAMARERFSSPVLYFRDYSAAFDFYLHRKTLLLTESQQAYDLYVAHPAMRDGPGIALVSREHMSSLLSDPAMQVATTIFFQREIESYLGHIPQNNQAGFERKSAGAYLLYRRSKTPP